MPIITKQMLREAKTARGGYTAKQIAKAKATVGNTRPMSKLVGLDVSDAWWECFCNKGGKRKPKKKKGKAVKLGPSPDRGDDWAWKPKADDTPQPRLVQTKKSGLSELELMPAKEFLVTREWRELRYRVLRKRGGSCECCGRNYRDHGVVVHVDHIKPRSKYPHLSLVFENLQVLCEDCNIGKSNKDQTDWRIKCG